MFHGCPILIPLARAPAYLYSLKTLPALAFKENREKLEGVDIEIVIT
jgi:hypothetical protein